MPHLAAQSLTRFAADLLTAGGVRPDEAAEVAESLVQSNLRGHDSHGVMRIPFYLDGMKKDLARTGAQWTVMKETGTTLVVDGNWGFGQTLARRLTGRLIEKARQLGVGVGTMRRSAHVGRLGEYCELAADAGLVSMMTVNSHGHICRVAPPGGKAPRLGTNPIAMGVPHPDGALLLDFGTSATAEGKVRVKMIAGQPCPDGWVIDSEGRPTNDPRALYADPPGSLLPMGGTQAYKGFGLGLMVEILSGALSGGEVMTAVPTAKIGNCVFMLVLDPDHFGGADHFVRGVTEVASWVRSCPTVDPQGEILLPGDPERRTLSQRTSAGIPIDDGNWRALVQLAERLGVTVPPVE